MRTIRIKKSTYEQLVRVKASLESEKKRVVPLDEVLRELLKKYERG